MDYRDERDALRARVESLEGALATAQADLERMRATEAALETSKREIQRLRSEVERLRPTQRPTQNRGLGLVIAGGSVVMMTAFGAALTLRGRDAPAPVVVEAPTPTAATAVPSPKEPEPAPRPAEPPRRPTPRRAVASRSAHAEWTATVAQSQGGPPVGTACKILAELAGDGSGAHVGELEVTCGTKFLYRSTDSFNGMSNNGSDATEEPGTAAGTLRHAITYQDQGTRSGRSQISLDTAQRTGVVWSDNVPTFRVELRIVPWSADRTGDPLIDPENRRERLSETVVRTGTVTKTEGTPPAAAGAACTVDVSPAQSGQSNCRIRVRCAGKLLYGDGSSGYNKCALKEGRIGRIDDERTDDGDPALLMDLAENTVVVRDDGDPSWKVTVLLARAQ